MFGTVAIVGVGLLGGSLGMALRQRGLAREVLGIARREETLDRATRMGALDRGSLDCAAAAGAEVVVLCAPVLSIPSLAERLAPHLAPGTLVTDVGSTKEALLAQLLPLLPPGVDLVGGHPMAGSEQGGVAAARADLYADAVWVLTRTSRSSEAAMRRLTALVEGVGAVPLELDAATHDAAVARVSHLPHLAAAAAAAAVTQGGVPGGVLRRLVAGGYRDTTRVAGGSPEMWRDICLTNRGPILAALEDLEAALRRLRGALLAGDGAALEAELRRCKAAREQVLPPAAGEAQ